MPSDGVQEVGLAVSDVGAVAESAEAESLFTLASGVPDADREKFGIRATRLGGGVVVSTLQDPSGFWSKIIGLGVTEPVTSEVIDAAVAFLVAHGSTRATFQIAPDRLPSDWDAIADRHGIRPRSSWLKLVCPVTDFRPRETSLDVRPITAEDANRAAEVIAVGFGMDPGLVASLYGTAIRSEAFRGFGVWDGESIVAAAASRHAASAASLYGAATLPEYRGRGAQSALVAARAAAAREAGYELLVTETWLPEIEGTNSSLNNMVRAGFRSLYVRENWLWTTDPGGA